METEPSRHSHTRLHFPYTTVLSPLAYWVRVHEMSVFHCFPFILNLFQSGFGHHHAFLPTSLDPADGFDYLLHLAAACDTDHCHFLKHFLARASMMPHSFGFLPSSWAVLSLSLWYFFIQLLNIRALTAWSQAFSFSLFICSNSAVSYSPSFSDHLYVERTHKYVSHLSCCFLIFLFTFLRAPHTQHIQDHSHDLPNPQTWPFSIVPSLGD